VKTGGCVKHSLEKDGEETPFATFQQLFRLVGRRPPRFSPMSAPTAAGLEPNAATAFVRANAPLRPAPSAPELRLHLADESIALWQKTEDELAAEGLPPPFWAFAWAGGQALARLVLDRPALVENKTVLDFGAGGGIAGIAAARAGAARVEASELDPFAIAAIEANAAANAVSVRARLEDLVGRDEGWDVVLAGDVAYEAGPAAAIFDWLGTLKARGADVLIGDPGRSFLPKARLAPLATYETPVSRELEDLEQRRTTVWRIST
jgi:predicted nicotinamide N-methyase